MFDIMKEYHEKFNQLNNLKTRTKDNEKRKQEVLISVADIYNQLYCIYKNKCNKKIESLDAENKKKLDYKKLRFNDNYQYPYDKEQEKEQKEEESEENKFFKYIENK